MIRILVSKKSTPSGAGTLLVKGKGRQRTTRWDHSLSADANVGAAIGNLLDVILTDREKAKILHPSGGQRVRESGWLNGVTEWHINV